MKLEFLHQSTEQRRERILHGNILQTLLMLSLPTLMMSVIQALLPLSDGLFINNAAGTLVASAVTYSEPVINMMISLAQGISVAAMAIIGQANGQGNLERVRLCETLLLGGMRGKRGDGTCDYRGDRAVILPSDGAVYPKNRCFGYCEQRRFISTLTPL